MLSLHGKSQRTFDASPFIARVTKNPNRPAPVRDREVLIGPAPVAMAGFRGYLLTSDVSKCPYPALDLPAELTHLGEGDVIRIEPGGLVVRDRDALLRITDAEH